MNQLVLHLSGKWHRFSSYEKNDGIIQPVQNATVKTYNPFDFFTYNMDFKQKNINKPINVNDLHIHASFASILSEEDALIWVNKFGLPYEQYIDKNGNICDTNFPSANTDSSFKKLPSISASHVITNANIFRSTSSLYDAIKSGDTETVRNTVLTNSFKYSYDFLMSKSYSQPSVAYNQHILDELSKIWDDLPTVSNDDFNEEVNHDPYWDEAYSDPIAVAQHYLSTFIAFTTQSVHETLIFEQTTDKNSFRTPKIGWKFNSLLALMYKMLFIDWTQGHSIRRCANKFCNTHFVPFNIKNEYCSDICVNRARAQRHRKKVSDAKKKKQTEV